MAIILDGRVASEAIINACREESYKLPKAPKLTIVSVGDDEASKVYIRNKIRVCGKTGIDVDHIKLNADASKIELYKSIPNDGNTDGVLIQFPVPSHLEPVALNILDNLESCIDIDGLGIENKAYWDSDEGQKPCTALGIMKLLEHYKISPVGKEVTIIGRSNLVGKPLASMLTHANATVSLCHSKTANVVKYTRSADIVVVAVGKSEFLTADMINSDAIVIDVGINRVGNRIVGDCASDVYDKAYAYTPVPGGVGQMTTAMLAYNVIKSAKERMR